MNETPATVTMRLSNASSLMLLDAVKAFGPKRGSLPLMIRLIWIEAKQPPEIKPNITGNILGIFSPYNVQGEGRVASERKGEKGIYLNQLPALLCHP